MKEIKSEIDLKWVGLKDEVEGLKKLLEKESPGVISEQVRACKNLIAAMFKR